MNSRVDGLLREATQLTEEEREALIAALQATLSSDSEWDAAWIRECEDRLAAYDRGEMQARDAHEVVDELRSGLRAR